MLVDLKWYSLRPAFPRYQLRYDEQALFLSWDVIETRIEGIGYKHERVVRSFRDNASALAYANQLLTER